MNLAAVGFWVNDRSPVARGRVGYPGPPAANFVPCGVQNRGRSRRLRLCVSYSRHRLGALLVAMPSIPPKSVPSVLLPHTGEKSLAQMTMVSELANEGKPTQARMLAGLLMKNSLYAKNDSKRLELQQKWAQLDEATRGQVKAGCLQTLRSPTMEVRNQACQVIAKIGGCELPNGQWLEVINQLKDMVVGGQDMNAKHGALVALGYLCQVRGSGLAEVA